MSNNPVSVIKGDRIIKDVYPSDLHAWIEDGYEVYDPAKPQEPDKAIAPEPTKKKAKPTPVETE